VFPHNLVTAPINRILILINNFFDTDPLIINKILKSWEVRALKSLAGWMVRFLKLGAYSIKKKLQPFSCGETPAILRYLLIIVV